MTTIFSMCLIALSLLVTPAWAGDVDAEVDFVTRASIGNLFAIAESELALSRADASELKLFAQQLIDDHEKAKAALDSAADGAGAKVPTTLDGDHQARVTALEKLSGTDFDTAYIADQGENHSNALTLYADYMLLGENPKLKALAIRMIPITAAQLKTAQQLAGN